MQKLAMATLLAVLLVGCGQEQATKSRSLDAKSAHFEAQKLLVVVDGKPRAAAFVDQALRNDDSYNQYFGKELKSALAAAPINEPSFSPYKSCVDAGNNLAKFAELRRLGGGQNKESDKFRSPFWDALDLCKKAVIKGEQQG